MLGYNLSLNRYLMVCRVNRSLVWFPNFPSVEMSLVLGTAIANRLPTTQARPWMKSLASWEPYLESFGGDISSLGKKKAESGNPGGKKIISRRNAPFPLRYRRSHGPLKRYCFFIRASGITGRTN